MVNSIIQILSVFILLCAISDANVCSPPPPITSTQTWVANDGCTDGTVYDTADRHCHCWGFCGYKCDLKATTTQPTTTTSTTTTTTPSTPTTTSTTTTTTPPTPTTPVPCTSAPTCTDPPPSRIPAGSTYTRVPGCPVGQTYIKTSPGVHSQCHCTYFCGYICTPLTADVTVSPNP